MIFTSLQQAEDFIASKIQHVFDQSRVLRDRLVKVGQLLRKAQETGNLTAAGQLSTLKSQTIKTFTDQLALEQKLSDYGFVSFFNIRTGLGVFPPVLAVAAAAVAGLIWVQLNKIENQGKSLDLIAKGFLDPADAAKILGGGGLFDLGLGGMFSPLLIVGVGFLIFYLKKGVAFKGVG